VPPPGAISAVPYAEPSAWQAFRSPYFTPQHLRFRAALRAFLQRDLAPLAEAFEASGKDPSLDLFQRMGRFGLIASRMGPAVRPWLSHFSLPAGVTAEQFDYFHELIAHEEMGRMGSPSVSDALGGGLVIGLPPVVHFGSPALRDRIVLPVLRGDKRIALAISEPFAGSDVANIRTTARKSPCGRFYVVNGVKKWITNGTFADYFATAVRTGGPGVGGISLLLIERGAGLATKKIKTAYSGCAGTAYVELEDVQVPVENLLGKENEGFKCIMANFNHERWLIIAGIVGATRLVVEESMKWAHQREAFGEKLIEKPVIRQKLGAMVAQLEGVQNWLENLTYQMVTMAPEDQHKHLAGPLALLKYQSTRTSDFISGEACQVFGGRALTMTGMGRVVTRFRTAQKFGAILGGSEEIMLDLGIRQAMRSMPPDARL
jgi:alkylation response protein AidB-like acyl-CoA dehydrogenase